MAFRFPRFAAAASVCAGIPVLQAVTVSGVTFEQDSASGAATVSYTLDAPAIVTVDVRTNSGDGVWVSIGADKLRHISGEVNKLVTTVNEPVSARWILDDDLQATAIPAARAVVTAWATDAPPPYMAVNLTDTNVVRYYVSEDALPYSVTDRLYKTEWLLMRRIPAAGVTWRMGSDADNRMVTFTKDYYIGVFEFTIGQYLWCGLEKASHDIYVMENVMRPACSVTYNFLRGGTGDGINWPETKHRVKDGSVLDNLRKRIGIEVDLPTEAQWEYACRAGTFTETYNGCANSESLASTNGWYGLSKWNDIPMVGYFEPNPWGLYDMYGGMLEWCLDWYNDQTDADDTVDPKGADESSNGNRIQRSSGWNDSYLRLKTEFRSNLNPERGYATVGFRIVAPCLAPNKDK